MVATAQTLDRFAKLAESLPAKIEHLRRPDRRENTPKRQREGMSARLDAANLERLHRALVAMSEAYTLGTLPAEFSKLTRKEIEPAVTRQSFSTGYYHIGESDKWRDDSTRAKKLRDWLGNRIDKDPAAAARDAVRDREAALRFSKIPGFFPTPESLIIRMIDAAELESGMTVLEPSAGKGDILDAVKACRCKGQGFEIQPVLADLCKLKGHTVDCCDFLKMQSVPAFDRVLMNPPFERGQDVQHVRKAFEWVKPGGRLVAIVSAAVMQDRAEGFRAWAYKYGTITPNEGGEFKGREAFRETGVRTCLVVLDMPMSEPHEPMGITELVNEFDKQDENPPERPDRACEPTCMRRIMDSDAVECTCSRADADQDHPDDFNA